MRYDFAFLVVCVAVAGIFCGCVTVTVPDVVGNTKCSAITTIRNARLQPDVNDYVYHNCIPSGLVAFQIPVSGTVINKGTTVSVVMSRGLEPEGD